MVLGSVIFTIISRCAWIRDGFYIGIEIDLLLSIILLLRAEAYELFIVVCLACWEDSIIENIQCTRCLRGPCFTASDSVSWFQVTR